MVLLTEEQIKTLRENKLDRNIVRDRVKAGWSIEKAITNPPRYTQPRLTIEQRKIAKQNNLDLHAVRSRLDRGWDIEKAITTPAIDKYKGGKNLSKPYCFNLHPDTEAKMLASIEKEGSTISSWLRSAVDLKLELGSI
jgi:hypothetical protein